MAAGARYAGTVLGRIVHLWEVQRILDGRKRIDGLEILRADEPLSRKSRKPRRKRKLSTEARRKLAEAGRKGGRAKKPKKDISKALLSEAKKGEKHHNAKLTEAQVWDIKYALAMGEKIWVLATQFKVQESLISMIKTGKRWKHLREADKWEE
jgi:hypothetical protein